MVVVSLATVVSAQPPSAQSEGSPAQRAVQQAHATVENSKPQIVYNVRSRETAEALHSQSKPASELSLPIDPSMPISLQLSRSNANAEAAAAARAAQIAPPPALAPRARKHKAQNGGRSTIPPGQAKQFSMPGDAGQGHGKRGNKGD